MTRSIRRTTTLLPLLLGLLGLLGLLVMPASHLRAEGEEEDRGPASERHRNERVAVVNGEVIQWGEVLARIGPAHRTLANPDPKVRRDLVDDEIVKLIADRLLLEAAEQQEWSIPRPYVEEQIQRQREQIERMGQSFDEFLDEQGLTLEDFREDTEKGLTIETFLLGQLGLRPSYGARDRPVYDTGVSPREARRWFARNQERFKRPADIRYRTITIAVSSYVTGRGESNEEAAAAARKVAEEARARLDEGVPFEDVAREYSQDRYREEGGDQGWREIASIRAVLRNALLETPIGSIGSVAIRSGRGQDPIAQFVIFRVEDRREERIAPFDDPETQKEVFEELRAEKLQHAKSKIVRRLARRATIEPERYRDLLLQHDRERLAAR